MPPALQLLGLRLPLPLVGRRAQPAVCTMHVCAKGDVGACMHVEEQQSASDPAVRPIHPSRVRPRLLVPTAHHALRPASVVQGAASPRDPGALVFPV